MEKKPGKLFENFKEAKINFLPSYKFDRGTDVYDTSEKHRTPSYTDRVIWKAKDGVVKVNRYDMCKFCKDSDHKPVVCEVEIIVSTTK